MPFGKAAGVTRLSQLNIDADLNMGAYKFAQWAVALVTKTGAYTMTASDYVVLVNATTGAVTITLPAAAGAAGRIYEIKKIDSSGNAVTIDADSTETIDGALTQVLALQYDSITIISDGSAWSIL